MARKKGKGRSQRKAAKGQANGEPEEMRKAPHTFVIYRGKVGKSVADLMKDFRKVMEPYTASKLKVLKSNSIKDFVSVAGPLNVTHMILFTKSSSSISMRLMRLPHGPTLTFRVHDYSLARDVVSSLKKPISYAKQMLHQPLLVLNNFSGEGQQMKLMATMFQNMFPSINVHKVNLNSIRRCVLFNFNAEENLIDFRQYTIKVAPTGVSRSIKKLIQSKIPNLANCNDISEYITGGGGNASESEAEFDDATNQVELPQKVSSRGNMVSEQSSIRLVEMGPRLTLELIKIEDGLIEGEVLYHRYITKTPEEIEYLRSQKETKKKLREKRRKAQEANVRAKQDAKLAQMKTLKPEKRSKPEEDDETGEKSDDESTTPKRRKMEEPKKLKGILKNSPANQKQRKFEEPKKQKGFLKKPANKFNKFNKSKKFRK